MKKWLGSAVLAVFTAITALAGDPLKKLASVHDFAFGGIGAAGTLSEGELAFREVLKRPSAEKDFLELLSKGNAQGRCYALVGLRHLNRKAYAVLAERFAHDKTKVSTIGGCIVMVQPMSSVAATIGAGRYQPFLKGK
jgi:hypothetical protein